jgi:selenide,water dikinase
MNISLTQFSHGSGCGCKIAPADLEKLLQNSPLPACPEMIVGSETRDDAAVYAWDSTRYLVSTVDFFMPIVDDAETFGRIASANALSDIYAMGGKPLMALALMGWPIEKIPLEVAERVLKGSHLTCREAGIFIGGGHTIDSPEPFFGLAVNGIVKKENLKRNSTARAGDLLYLTKPLGTGIITAAHKRNLVDSEDLQEAIRWMVQLNALGERLGELSYVTALTDVTGFGLLGHLLEMCNGSHTTAEIEYARVPLMTHLTRYTSRMIYPDNTMRNWQSYGHNVSGIGAESLLTLCDPQTNGGLLISVQPEYRTSFEEYVRHQGQTLFCIGQMRERGEFAVVIK